MNQKVSLGEKVEEKNISNSLKRTGYQIKTAELACEILRAGFSLHEQVRIRIDQWFCDPGLGMESSGVLEMIIEQQDCITVGEGIEITILGKAVNQRLERTKFSCFFALTLRKPCVIKWFPQKIDRKQSGTSKIFNRLFSGNSRLPDSVFEVSLLQEDTDGVLESIGHGRGFLFFNFA